MSATDGNTEIDFRALYYREKNRVAELEQMASVCAEVVNLVWSANMLMNPALWRDMIREKARVALNIPKP